jgi:redox-sensitive bicupin YhaK (pirin superfamily)
MTAGRGIVHSEMPLQREGRMHGFQLWLNLPAREKMKPASYRDIDAADIPRVDLPGGGTAKVIAGVLTVDGVQTRGAVQGITTEPLFLDVALPAGQSLRQPLPVGHHALVYPYQGAVEIAGSAVRVHEAGVLSDGASVEVAAVAGARFLVLAARPLAEPVVQYGPFVMNTTEEIEQALADYRAGRLTGAPPAATLARGG